MGVTIVTVNVTVAELQALSETSAVNCQVPGVAGMPESLPLPSSVRPGGSWPLTRFQWYGAVPPLTGRVVS